MQTIIQIFRPGQPVEKRSVEFKGDKPSYANLKAVIKPLLDGAGLEHVAVLWNGGRRDMFVDECGQLKGLPRNDEATKVYRNNWLTQHPKTDPEAMPWIAGPAILFDDVVWS